MAQTGLEPVSLLSQHSWDDGFALPGLVSPASLTRLHGNLLGTMLEAVTAPSMQPGLIGYLYLLIPFLFLHKLLFKSV